MTTSSAQPRVALAAGGVVYQLSDLSHPVFLLVGRGSPVEWRFPKGLQAPGCELVEETAIREVKEESGYQVTIERYLCSTRWTYEYQGETIDKTVLWFLMQPQPWYTGEHDDEYDKVTWMDSIQALESLTYESEKNVLNLAMRYLET